MSSTVPTLNYATGDAVDQTRRRVARIVAWTAMLFGILSMINMAFSTYHRLLIAQSNMSGAQFSRFAAGVLIGPCGSIVIYAILAVAGLFLLNGVGFAAGLLRVACILLIGWTLALGTLTSRAFFQRSTMEGIEFLLSALPFLCLPTMLILLPIRGFGGNPADGPIETIRR